MVTHHSHEATSQSQPAHMSTHQMQCMDSALPSAEQKKHTQVLLHTLQVK